MTIAPLHRSTLAIGAVVTVSAVLPFGFTACASTGSTAKAAELHAAAGGDVLSGTSDVTYEISGVEVIDAAEEATTGSAVGADVTSQGFFVLSDGMITQAELSLSVPDATRASFVLSEPAVLRGELGEAGKIVATGVLTVNGAAQPHTKLKLIPLSLNESDGEFEVSFSMPENPLVSGSDSSLSGVTMKLTLTAH